jgi:hypothetical protein
VPPSPTKKKQKNNNKENPSKTLVASQHYINIVVFQEELFGCANFAFLM